MKYQNQSAYHNFDYVLSSLVSTVFRLPDVVRCRLGLWLRSFYTQKTGRKPSVVEDFDSTYNLVHTN